MRGRPATDPGDYETYRRFHIYRTALEGALKDGRIDPLESDILTKLRHTLVINDTDHARLVAELGTSA